MDTPRYSGKLKKWNAERGFGFIVADDGGQDVFVHISAFMRDGRQPVDSEILTFEVEPDRNGKRSAVRVRRPGDVVRAAQRSGPSRPRTGGSRRAESEGFIAKAFTILVICGLAWFAYTQYARRAATFNSVLPAPPISLSPAKLPAPPDFKCDGRHMCSQMTSCREATLLLQNCPGMQMDGNGDGIPCEQQWCVK